MLCCRSPVAKNVTRLLAKFQKQQQQQQHCRSLLVATAKFGKHFHDNENEHAFTVLDNGSNLRTFPKPPAVIEMGNFSSSIQNALLNVSDVPIEELHNRFVLITSYIKDSEASIEEPRFNPLIDKIIEALPKTTFDQIVDILTALKYWPSTGSIRSPNFCALWSALDFQCTSRCDEWKTEQLLKIAYLWFQLKFIRMTTYNSKMIDTLGHEINVLSRRMVVEFLFFINLQRKQVSAHLATEIENRLMKDLEHFTLDELGVAALGFFKTQTPLKSEKLLTAIIAKILMQPDEVREMTLAALLKLIRSNSTYNILKPCRELQHAFISRVDHLQTSTLTHLILLVAHHLVCHNELLMKVALKLSRDIRLVRLKDLSRSLYCLAMFQSFTPLNRDISVDYANQVVDELKLPERQQEIEDYPVHFVSLILSLAYMDIFPEDLINICLGKKFMSIIQQTNTDFNMTRELAVIDNSVEIECPWYKGSRLPSSIAEVFKKHQSKASNMTHQDRLLHDICESTMDIFGISQGNYLQICHILPHFHMPDILFILDNNGSLKPIPNEAKSLNWNIIRPNTSDKWFAVVCGGRAAYQRDHRQVTGATEMKLRQLKKLGYTVVMVPWFIYTSLHKGLKEKYIKTKIFENL